MTLQIECPGISPLPMHSHRASDPLSREARRLSEPADRRGKTEADLIELARRQFHCSLYLDAAGRSTVPVDNVHSIAPPPGRTRRAGAVGDFGKVNRRGPPSRWRASAHDVRALRPSLQLAMQPLGQIPSHVQPGSKGKPLGSYALPQSATMGTAAVCGGAGARRQGCGPGDGWPENHSGSRVPWSAAIRMRLSPRSSRYK